MLANKTALPPPEEKHTENTKTDQEETPLGSEEKRIDITSSSEERLLPDAIPDNQDERRLPLTTCQLVLKYSKQVFLALIPLISTL
ncbi:MAG TPA: hypothetical protein VJL60_05010, partial [Gammaproteobacteria bacterium]|nr:hypothetical protein [Gammaproteobacteria bacterium]